MKKLKYKVFFIVLFILNLSLLSFIVIFSIQSYLQEKKIIENNLHVVSIGNRNAHNVNTEKPLDINIRFIDRTIYEIELDDDNNIVKIINRSNNSMSNDDIQAIAQEILSKKTIEKKYIGNLYFDDYSYSFVPGNYLIILDNSSAKENLINKLEISILIFIILEFIMIVISKLIAEWISKPVEVSFEKQKEFIADASHELKTPLSVIMASGEALAENPKETKWLNNIQNESERMNKLITNLLDLAKSEKENLSLTRENLSKVVEISILTFEAKAFEKKLQLKSQIDENIYLNINEDAIKQLLEILLDNAIKHSNSKEVINVSLKDLGKNIELLVQNKGDVIPKGEEEKIFERFYRVEKSRNRNDNRYGLGLAIAKNIVLSHSGKISATSNNGLTTFKVLLKK